MLTLPQVVHKIVTDTQFRADAGEDLLEKLNLEPSALTLLRSALVSPALRKSLQLPDGFPDISDWAAYSPGHAIPG